MTALRPFELFNFHLEQKGFTTFPFIISEVMSETHDAGFCSRSSRLGRKARMHFRFRRLMDVYRYVHMANADT